MGLPLSWLRAGMATTKWNLRRHFNDRHPGDKISIPGEGVLPNHCGLCGMQTNVSNAPRHDQSDYCQTITRKRLQHKHKNVAADVKALYESFFRRTSSSWRRWRVI